MAADTNLTLTQIELGIARYFNFRNNLVVPNVSWGMLNHEADIIVMSKSGYLTEVEIKRSWADFLADFRKKHDHQDSLVSYYFYAVPSSILDKCRAKLEEVDPFKRWGLLSYSEETFTDGDVDCWVNLQYLPSNSTQHNPSKKLTLEQQYQLARLGNMRSWTLKNKLVMKQKEIVMLSSMIKRIKEHIKNGSNS